MRFNFSAICVITSLFVTGLPAFADGLIRTLPAPGDWSTFRMTENWSDGTAREINVTLKALAKRDVDGIECTWVELVLETPDGHARKAFRFLTPDRFLRTGDDPLGNAKEVWVRNLNDDPRQDQNWDNFLPRLMLVCPPDIHQATVVDENENADVEEQADKEDVVTERGTQKFYEGTLTIDTQFRLVTSGAVPFGVTRATLNVTQRKNCDLDDPDAVCQITTGTVKFDLTASGSNAESLIQLSDALTDEQ